ncbi:MAG: radical SAM protein [Clostridia bacterium]|nr:radical SAM protein [Clostridia bacterium]
MAQMFKTGEFADLFSAERGGTDAADCSSDSKYDAAPALLSKEESKIYYTHIHLPSMVRLEACTLCQLRCAGCGVQKGGNDGLGRGYLTIENFTRFCDMNPFVRRIELSNYGEIFLNPDLVKIMHHAKKKGILLSAHNGSNFNTVSDEQMLALVETGFRSISLSIDGASQQTYSKYRIGGDFDRVIENIRKLLALKKEAGSEYPELSWQFILMEHNELDIGKAKELAAELGIPIRFKYNWDPSYKPIHREYIMRETGLGELTVAESRANHKFDPYEFFCYQIFFTPQINWDGRLLGCSRNRYATFDVNVFEVGLAKALRSPGYIAAKECLLRCIRTKRSTETASASAARSV